MTRDRGGELEAGGLGGSGVPPGSLSESDCVILAQSGHRGAQAEIVRGYTTGLYSLFARLVGDRHLAADLTQEVFLRVFASLTSFDPDKSFRAWVYAIAWNLARDHLRKRARRRTWLPRLVRPARADTADAAGMASRDGLWQRPREEPRLETELADPRALPPVDALEARERLQAVRAALDRIEPRKRALLMLKEFEDLSLEELAALFGCGIGTVKSRLNRARLAFKDALQEMRPEWFDERSEVMPRGASS